MTQKITFWVKKCYFLAINVIFGQKKAPAARAGTTKKAFEKNELPLRIYDPRFFKKNTPFSHFNFISDSSTAIFNLLISVFRDLSPQGVI